MRLWMMTALGMLVASGASAATYYVSPQGDDANTGLGAGPGEALRTVQAGVDRLAPGDVLALRAGTYRETVTFHRGGEAGRPLVLRPYGDGPVVISGCDPLDGWEVHDSQKGLWKAAMPWTLGLGRNQVFEDGQVRLEARYPNVPDPGLAMYVSDLSPLWPTFGEFSLPQETAAAQPGRIVSKLLEGQPDDYWKGACYYGIHYEGWAAQTGVVESSRSGEISLTDRTRTWWFGTAYGGGYSPEEGRGMLVGHMHALDQPGEWVWQEGTLYLMTEGGRAPGAVEAKRRQLAFDLSGCEHIRVEGLKVKAASVRMQDAAWCTFEGCDLSYISHYTLHYDTGQVENGRDTLHSGETGIFVGGHDNAFLNCSVRISAGAGFYLRGYHHTIHNCLIDEVSYTSHYLNAITDAVSDFGDYEDFLYGGHVITYNTMRNAGRHLFNFHGNGTSLSSRDRGPMDYMATLFAHNHLYNGMLQTRDAGMITGYYCSGGTLDGINSQVAYNVLHDTYDIAAMKWGVLGIVYLDAGTCDVDLHHNLLWAAPGSLQRGLWYNTMCVDVHEHDNLFHPEFTRTSAELTAADFPEGKPFRFGHDFDNPPPVPTWPLLDKQRLAGPFPAEGLYDGAVVDLGEVDFDQGWQSVVMRFASDQAALNSDHSDRAAPRHRKATDPLAMEAITNDGLSPGVATQWTFIYNVADGAWVKFAGVPLGEGYRRFRAIYGNDQPTARSLEVHLDSPEGPLAGTVALPPTDVCRGGRIQIYAQATGQIAAEATGTHDVYVVFHSPDGKPVGEFEYFRFEQTRGQMALHSSDARFELRVGRPGGELIGEVFPRGTGGADTWRDLVASLEPVQGRQRLFLVVRAAVEGSVGRAQWVSLEKAAGGEVEGLGAPPLMRDGALVLPAATNRPCARPADKYPRARAAGASTQPKPIAVARRPGQPVVVDGELGEWPAEGALALRESYDGTLSAAPESRAWVSYDDAAWYVAMRHPVANAAALLPSSRVWGQVDGVEVAFGDGYGQGNILTLYGYPDGAFESGDLGGATAAQRAALEQQVTYRAAVAQDAWTCEWRIPFAACGFTPQTAPLARLNLGALKTAPRAWVIWRGTGGATYQVAGGGLLVFEREALAAGAPRDGLALWLDAAQADSVLTDEEGRVEGWLDRSGNGHDARQAEASHRPKLDADGLNGHPALRFDEADMTRLELPDLAEGKITATAFAMISNPVAGAEVNHDSRLLTASDGEGYDYQVGIALTVPGMETGGPRVRTGVFRDAWAKFARVGCFSPNYQTYFTGHIAEILLYERVVEGEEADRVRAYLSAKWGGATGSLGSRAR